MNKTISRTVKLTAVMMLVMVLATLASGVIAAPASVTLVGDLQDELGCGGDWDPACAATHLLEQGNDVWRAEFNVPAGDFNYKMALNDTWDVSFPADNKPLSLGAAADVRFYYDDKSNAVLDSVNDQIAVAAGSFQNALGCGGDWQPECVNTLLTDVDGDGIYTFSATGLPAGSYEFKVALDEAWDVSYPADNVPVTINADSELLTISWDSVTTGVSVDVSSGEPAVDWVVAGDFQDALTGSACGNWNNTCAETTMEDDDGDGVFRLIADALPAGGYEYKVVEFNNWDNAFPADNVAFTADGSQMRWYFQPGPNNVADNANQCIATVAGDFQDELGGPEWSPSNLRTMMWQEAPGSDWYAFSATLPAGSWQYKVALDEDWAESYPADNVALELGAETAVTIRYNCASNAIEQVLGGEVPDEIAALVTDPARNPIEDDVFYFVMPDRFSNGDPSNDTGGIPGDRLQNGFDPTDMGFFHGGDLAGLTAKLDYMKEMGTTAIWMTPVFKNNPVQGEGADVSAGYHGYWYLDMTEFDPHFGTNNELTTLIDEAHARDIKVFFDIITNHTADIVSYEEGTYGYRDKETYPYRDADGVAFDDRDYVGTGTFPALDPAVSFPYTPVFLDPSGETAKVPAWLNNPNYYHNRGNSTFSGENSLYGDFYGLDDLFTEHPDVVNGMTQIYKDWITGYDIDGFRVDTVKHVNLEFWQEFMPQILAHAEAVGREDFFVFGEVFSGNPELLSHYTSQADFPAVLDFNFQERVRSYASAGGSSDVLRDLFADDDYYTDADSNAYALPTFIGNHDRGRFGWFLNADNGGSLSDEEMVARSELATATMFFARGVPVIYYGDEQGFTGTGGDKEARQDMFPSQVAHYMAEDQIGTDATPADDNFDSTHPLYQAYAEMAQVVAANPALQTGAQLHRYSQDSPGIYAFSRIDPDQALEYLVVLNNSTAPQTAVFKTEGANMTYNEIYPGSERVVTSDDFKEITVDAPGVSISVFKAESAYAPSESAPGVSFNTLASGQQVEIGSQNLDGNDVQDRIEVGVALSNEQYAEVTFAVRKSGTEPYTVIGVDDNAPYRVFFSLSDVPGGFVEGDMLDFVAVAKDSGGNLSYAEVTGITPIFSEAPQPGAVTHAIIHYFREDGDYGDHTTGDYNDYWGLHLWGDITETIEWTAPKPFLGEDEYGRFAWVNLTPNATNVGVIAHRGDTKDPLNAPDRFFNPSVSPEIWLKQDDLTIYTSQAAAQGYVTIRYHRDDGDYGTPSSDYTTYWGLHLWGSALADGVGTDWTSPRPFDGIDDFGAFWQVPIQNAAGDFNFIIHRGDAKDPGPDQALNPQEMPSAWIMSGDETIYPQRGAAEGFITLHYHRPAGDYGDYASTNYADFWGLHTWGDADDPGWTTPRKPAFTDTFGPAFQVPLINAMQEIGYILHRGDTKDPGPDQALNVNDWGYEVWQLQAVVPDVANEPQFILPLHAGAPGPNPGDISMQEAYWVDQSTILWDVAADSGLTFTLHYAPEGGLVATENGITAGDSIVLTTGSASQEVKDKFPHLADLPALAIPEEFWDMIPEILKGQIAVSAVNAEGTSVDATGLQIPGVLDDLYSYNGDLGVTWDGGVPTIRVWAPTAKSVALHLYDDSDPDTAGSAAPMTLDPASGVWSITGDASWKDKFYLFEVEIYVHSTGQVEHNMVTDPYSFSLSMNSTRSQIVDLEDQALKPAGWDDTAKPELVAPEDISIYEVHVRDFSRSDPLVPAEYVGTYKAFTLPDSNGVKHLKALQAAGLSHLHLLPVFDIATIDENKANWQLEDWGELAGYAPDGEEQQAAITAVNDLDAFNWGYDPYHYTTPEGSYSTNPDGTTRIVEFREMVKAINEDIGLRVVMDVVYNHTNSAGQSEKSVLDKIVPGYYHRLDDQGNVETSTCCQNTASEHNMMEKLMIDSLVVWAKEYKVDAFRFDLMGHHMKANMLNVRAALDALTLEEDGVDGKSIYLYGEGWNFGEVADNARGVNATQLNMAGTGIGTFSDRLRDAVRGGGPFDSGEDLVRNQGFANGLYYDPNALNSGSQSELDELLLSTDQIRVGMAGNLAGYEFVDRYGNLVTGAQVDYNGSPAGYTADPQENISYISKHDNQTLYDNNTYKTPDAVSMEDRVRIQNVGLSTVLLGQGVPFMHAGSDLLRSKSLDRDSYNSGDWFNKLDFTYQSNNFGVGLPVAGVNQDNWGIMQPFLANTALQAGPQDIMFSAMLYQELLALRESSPLFHLQTADEIQQRVVFHNTGPDQIPGLIVMTIDDTAEPDLDGANEEIIVLINANDEAQTFTIPGAAGSYIDLSGVQQASVDDRVQTSTFDIIDGEFSVPARTTAVFVQFEHSEDMIGDLIDHINDLVDEGIINQGNGTALIQDLQHALRELERGDADKALKFMNDFIKRVERWSGKQIPADVAGTLLAYAQAIISNIEAGA